MGQIKKMIRKLPNQKKWRIYSKTKVNGKHRNLGTFSSLKKAEKHEREIQFFKHR
jgi:hypothetical protein